MEFSSLPLFGILLLCCDLFLHCYLHSLRAGFRRYQLVSLADSSLATTLVDLASAAKHESLLTGYYLRNKKSLSSRAGFSHSGYHEVETYHLSFTIALEACKTAVFLEIFSTNVMYPSFPYHLHNLTSQYNS